MLIVAAIIDRVLANVGPFVLAGPSGAAGWRHHSAPVSRHLASSELQAYSRNRGRRSDVFHGRRERLYPNYLWL